MAERSEEDIIAVCHRSLAEIAWYLQKMQSFPSKQIAFDAALALEDWKGGNRKPAQTVLIRWYNTLRKATGIEKPSDKDLATHLNMAEVLSGNDTRRHLALLGQMFVTLEHQ